MKVILDKNFNPIGTVFYSNDKIVSLKALRYFNFAELPSDAFSCMPNLREVWIPATVKSHWYRVFLSSPSVKIVVILAKVPFGNKNLFYMNTFNEIPKNLRIYVPDESIEAYKEAWKGFRYANRLHPLSEYQG